MLPTNSHDWALWLQENLEGVSPAGGTLWHGTLPRRFDFHEITNGVDAFERLRGVHDEHTRQIEFHPSRVGVYGSMDELIRSNRRRVPTQYTIRDLRYTSTSTASRPDLVVRYVDTVRLWDLLTRMADHVDQDGLALHFIKSHDSRIAISADYGQQDLIAIPSLNQFASEFVETEHHKDQKRSILRTALVERFKGQKKVLFAEVLPVFESILENVRSSYAMYVAEFSFEKVKAEVEKDNLESTLKLNKTFSEIQNQLLAIPVALVLVAGQITQSAGWTLKNVVIWLGSLVFAVLMFMLIHNQRNAISAVGEEIELRSLKIKKQPREISAKFEVGFEALRKRRRRQDVLLTVIGWLVGVSFAFSTAVLVWYSVAPVTGTPGASGAGPSTK